jgi:hypothetical protein
VVIILTRCGELVHERAQALAPTACAMPTPLWLCPKRQRRRGRTCAWGASTPYRAKRGGLGVNADDDVQPTTPLRSGEPWLVPAPWTSAIPLIRDLLAFPGPATPQSVAVYYLALFIGRRGLLAGSRKSNNTTISPNGRSRKAASRYMYMIYGPPATAAAVVGLSRASVTDLLHQASPFVL